MSSDQDHDEQSCTSLTCNDCLKPHVEVLAAALPSSEDIWIVLKSGQYILKPMSSVFALCSGCDKKHELSDFIHSDDENEDE